jgi:predicted aldo/keto reductase-like oxidoreductase
MRKVTLGKTGLKVNNVGFGGIPMQRTNIDKAKKIIDFCINKGVTFFDSARAYTVSEKYIGNAVKDCRQDVILASKAPAFTYEEMMKQAKISLAELNTDKIDLYQVHNIKTFEQVDGIFGECGSYAAFLELKAQGKILHFGLTSHKREILEYAVDKHADKIESIMFPYNIVENQGVALFRKAKKHDIATIAMKPLAGGNLDDVSLALRYVLDNDFIDIAIPGIGSVEEAEQDLSVELTPLAKDDKLKCEKIVQTLGNDFCRRCGYCCPCTVGIDIPTVFVMHNYVKKYDLKAWAQDRYNTMVKKASDCIRCGICETRCPYSLQIMQKMDEAKREFGE